jgi:hypothetical protein
MRSNTVMNSRERILINEDKVFEASKQNVHTLETSCWTFEKFWTSGKNLFSTVRIEPKEKVTAAIWRGNIWFFSPEEPGIVALKH